MIMIKMTMIGLVILPIPPKTPEDATDPISTSCKEVMISVESTSNPSPYPVIPAVKLACKEIAHDGMVLEPYSDRVVRDLLCQS